MTKLERKDFMEAIGMCTECGEWTSVLEPCCGAGVNHEGSIYHFEEFEEEESA